MTTTTTPTELATKPPETRVSMDVERAVMRSEDSSSSGTRGRQAYVFVRERNAGRVLWRIVTSVVVHLIIFFLCAAFSVLAVIFSSASDLSSDEWQGVPLYRYFIWLATLTGGWLVLNFTIWVILTIADRLQRCGAVRFFRGGLTKSIQYNLTFVILAAVLLALTQIVLGNINEVFRFYLNRALGLVVLVFGLRMLVAVGQEVATIRINKTASGDKVIEQVRQQNILLAIAKGKKLRIRSSVETDTGDDKTTAYVPTTTEKPPEDDDNKSGLATFAAALSQVLTYESFVKKLTRSDSRTSVDEQARLGAARIMKSADTNGKGYFTESDIAEFFRIDTEVHAAFVLFDRFSCGQVSLEDAVAVVSKVLKSHDALYHTLIDRGNAAAILSRLVTVVFWIIMFIIALLMFGLSPSSLLLPVSTTFLGFSFIFGDSLKQVWESILLIFVVRPFEIGDRIAPDGYPTVIVDRIFLLTTHAHTPDGKGLVIPNNKLFTSAITLLKKSRNYALSIDYDVSTNTPIAAIDELDRQLDRFFKTDTSAPWSQGSYMMWIDSVPSQSVFRLSLWVELDGVTWGMPGKYLNARSIVIKQMRQMASQLAFEYALPLQPVVLIDSHREPLSQFQPQKQQAAGVSRRRLPVDDSRHQTFQSPSETSGTDDWDSDDHPRDKGKKPKKHPDPSIDGDT